MVNSDSCGSVLNLFIKSKHGFPTIESQTLSLKVGHGIAGDINANAISPRQILLVRNEDLLELSIPPGELKENVVIGGLDASLLSPGALIESNKGAAIRLTFYCEPCKRIAPLVDRLKTIERKRGILGVILTDSTLSIGDRLTVKPHTFPALSEIPYERFLNFIAKVPNGKVVTYKQVIAAIGVSDGYFRALPNYLIKAAGAGYPAHRVVDSQGNLTPHLSQQKEKLEAEKIELIRGIPSVGSKTQYSVSLPDYNWEDSTLYL
ncbi:MGMT family protein [Oscillatoria sp. FACHB-1406]|uniref:MGMT family protein n=1 Tax=Oscillatoria sp. FACHB-1406 TaxID=2692846 RepID=UPI001688D144|nr:MGMT family protein [Oscillatoria sp. FACHB-1406]MBD2579297.1 MGMT family protein [Oscillatoria sp. FACHB-1406]